MICGRDESPERAFRFPLATIFALESSSSLSLSTFGLEGSAPPSLALLSRFSRF